MTQEGKIRFHKSKEGGGNSVKIHVHKHTASREVEDMPQKFFLNFIFLHIASGAFSGVCSSQLPYLP